MAVRPVFVASDTGIVEIVEVAFEWYPGFSISQKQKSIAALHSVATSSLGEEIGSLLEVSSKSSEKLGVDLSAFNLSIVLKDGNRTTVESVFQGSKVFEQGGPFKDLIWKSSREAKKDNRIKNSGRLLKFNSNGIDWPLDPPSAFYDWIYINALHLQPALVDEVSHYNAFTDIEFNPKKQINCQAYSVALYVALKNHSQLDEALKSPTDYLDLMRRKRNRI